MKKYHTIEPEVIVGLGDETIFNDLVTDRKQIVELHIDLEDWLGDDLMENSSCFIVTEFLMNGLLNSQFTGFTFEDMVTTKAEYFNENYSIDKSLPNFFWMKIHGNIGDDFVYSEKGLEISEEALNFLKKNYTINYLDIDKEADSELIQFLNSLIEKDK